MAGFHPSASAHVGLGRGPVPAQAARLRANGTTIVGGVGWDPSGQWSETLLDHLEGIDVLIVNDHEAVQYTRAGTVDAALDVLAGVVDTAVVTLGPRGAVAARGSARLRVPAIEVHAVDPTGAGDAFAAAFMAATAWNWELPDRLRLASVCATCSVRGAGGARSAPHPAEHRRPARRLDADPGWTSVRHWAERLVTSPSPQPQEP